MLVEEKYEHTHACKKKQDHLIGEVGPTVKMKVLYQQWFLIISGKFESLLLFAT